MSASRFAALLSLLSITSSSPGLRSPPSRARALEKAAHLRRRVQDGTLAPLSTCACDNSLSQSWKVPPLIVDDPQAFSDVIVSQADPSMCWSVADEVGVCDGPCLVVYDCAYALTFSRWPAPNGVDSIFRVNDPDRDDDGWCVQENKARKFMQVWACGQPGNYTPALGQSYSVVPDEYSASSIIDMKVDVGSCVGSCGYSISSSSTPSPSPGSSPSASPTPSNSPIGDAPLYTCPCDGSDAQAWQTLIYYDMTTVQNKLTGQCWNVAAESGVCDGACLAMGDCNGPNAAYFTRRDPVNNTDEATGYFIVTFSQAVPDVVDACVQQNIDAGYMQV